jgi:hypothetical protein
MGKRNRCGGGEEGVNASSGILCLTGTPLLSPRDYKMHEEGKEGGEKDPIQDKRKQGLQRNAV